MALLMLAGCAGQSGGYGSEWEPIVDIRPAQQAQYANDLADCQQLARKASTTGQGAAVGAAAGAALGAVLSAAAGNNTRTNTQMAGVGAVTGAVGGAGRNETSQRAIISRCLSGRGYSVLN